jgi:hypothetical protein
MHKINVKMMSHDKVLKILGLIEEKNHVETSPPPPCKLYRTYKATCPACCGFSSTIMKYERYSVCLSCKMKIGKQALNNKVKRSIRLRTRNMKRIKKILDPAGIGNLPLIQEKISDYLVY